MILYLVISSTLLSMIPFFYFEGHKITKHIITDNFNKCRNLNNIMKITSKGNRCKAISMTITIISKMLWLMFLQWLNNSIKKIDRKTSVLTYVFAGKKYKLIIKPKRGPSPILQISNEKFEDLTDEIMPYLGPKYNWHGDNFNPSFFGCKTLTFECSDGKSTIFKNEEICKLSV